MHHSITRAVQKAKHNEQVAPLYARAFAKFAEIFNEHVPNLRLGLYQDEPAFLGDCPFCEQEGGFIGGPFGGGWGCHGCMQEGNFTDFLQRVHPVPLGPGEAQALANELFRPVNEGRW